MKAAAADWAAAGLAGLAATGLEAAGWAAGWVAEAAARSGDSVAGLAVASGSEVEG